MLAFLGFGALAWAAVVWLVAAAWVYVDASRRFVHRGAVAGWVIVAFAWPLVGCLVYALARPAQTPGERRARRVRLAYLEIL